MEKGRKAIAPNPPAPTAAATAARAEMHNETSRDGAFTPSEEMRRYRRRYRIKFAVFVILCAFFWLGILCGFTWLTDYSEAFRNVVVTLILRFPWLLAGFFVGIVIQAREAKRDEEERERMFPGRREQNRKYEAYRLQKFHMLGR